MLFRMVVLDYKYHISFPSNFTVYTWCVTKVAHCSNEHSASSQGSEVVALPPSHNGALKNVNEGQTYCVMLMKV